MPTPARPPTTPRWSSSVVRGGPRIIARCSRRQGDRAPAARMGVGWRMTVMAARTAQGTPPRAPSGAIPPEPGSHAPLGNEAIRSPGPIRSAGRAGSTCRPTVRAADPPVRTRPGAARPRPAWEASSRRRCWRRSTYFPTGF
jgi:hypothetical protein